MCIFILSTAHPDYPLILLSNRDEFLHRPTQRAAFWEAPYENVFSGRDLARPERGTWLGVSKEGRLAILTNYREPSSALAIGEKSRGAVITSFLTSPEPVSTPTKSWIHKMLETGEMKGVGGLSMLCGTLRPLGENLDPLAVISNRTIYRDDGVELAAQWVGATKGETCGLSNSLFDNPWPKVKLGEQLLADLVRETVEEMTPEAELLERCFELLSHNTMPEIGDGDSYESEMDALMLTVFVPAFDAADENAESKRAQSPEPEGEAEPARTGDAVDATHTMNGVQTAEAVDATHSVNGVQTAEAVDATHTVNGVQTAEAVVADQTKEAAAPLRRPRKLTVDTDLGSTHVDHICLTPTMPPMSDDQRKSPRLYGTAQQTVILVDNNGRLKYVERTLYDQEAQPVLVADRDVSVEFWIEGWTG